MRAEPSSLELCRTDAKPRGESNLLELFRGAKEEDKKSIVKEFDGVKERKGSLMRFHIDFIDGTVYQTALFA